MSGLTADTAIRLLVIGQELLVAIVFLSGRGAAAIRVSGALLVLCVAGYLVTSGPALREALPYLLPLTSLLAIAAPYALWGFSRAVFEVPWPDARIVVAVAAAVVTGWSLATADAWVSPASADLAADAVRILSLVVVGHALWIAWAGRGDDLVESRRAFRLVFVGVVAVQVVAVLMVELAFGAASVPGWLDTLNVTMIGLLTLVLAVPMLSLNVDFFSPARKAGALPSRDTDPEKLPPSDAVLREKLLRLVEGGFYRETGLTIGRLAAEVGYPEHQVRRLINGHLGYRNFSAFLNRYRVDEARRQLADPERARTPVLTIALDLGYASIGPFNRSFRERTGVTPTEYRRRQLGAPPAESG